MLLPKIILEALTNPKLSLSDVSLNHVFILCSKEQKESVRKYFIEQYILIRISEIDKLLENYDSVSLYGREYDFSFENSALVLSEDCLDKYDEEETEDLKEIDGYYWSFNPHEIENYGITITEIENGFLIQYDVPVYRDDYGDNILDYSDAMEGSMKNLSKKYPDVKYYGYEGYYSSDTSDGACSQSEFYSSSKEIPDINSFIGNNLTSLNWNVVINSFGEYEDMNEEKENELIVFAMKYKEFIGNYTISILKEALEEYRMVMNDITE